MKTLYPLASRRAILLYSLLALVLFAFTASGQQVPRTLIAKNNVQIGFYEYKPVDYSLNPLKKYPVIVFLHGIGERGNGTTELSKVLDHGIPKLIRRRLRVIGPNMCLARQRNQCWIITQRCKTHGWTVRNRWAIFCSRRPVSWIALFLTIFSQKPMPIFKRRANLWMQFKIRNRASAFWCKLIWNRPCWITGEKYFCCNKAARNVLTRMRQLPKRFRK